MWQCFFVKYNIFSILVLRVPFGISIFKIALLDLYVGFKHVIFYMQCGSAEDISTVVTQVEEFFRSSVLDSFQKLAAAVPAGQYFRFQHAFCHTIQVPML